VKGYIKFFDVRKRIGFIVPNGVPRQDRDRHVFFHETDLAEGAHARGGEIVEYSLSPHFPNPVFKNPRAWSVQVLSKPTHVPAPVPIDEQRKAVANGD
jgi:cold shock CspA family protein